MNKAQLVKQLKAKNIPIPPSASIGELEHRLENWEGGEGYLFRLAIPASRKGPDNPAHLLEFGSIYWVPNSRFARLIAETQLVFIMGRENSAPKGTVLLDVPKDFNDRWGIGVDNGNNQ